MQQLRESSIIGRFWVVEFGNRDDVDDQKDKEANEGSDEGPRSMVAKGMELVTDLVPPCM
jgi:hypothetical protein